jgi:hypothetical protein
MAHQAHDYDGCVDRPRPPHRPGEQRPRRLERSPSERYATVPRADTVSGEHRPRTRGLVAAVLAGIAGAVAIAVGGGLLTITAGLLVVAAVVGWAVAVAPTLGTGVGGGADRVSRRWTAALIALGAVSIGQVGLWLIARGEGGTLGLVDYLAEVFGVLVPAELLIAAAVAWWRAP